MQNHLTLSQLQKLVKATLDEAFALPVWVSAEIAEIKINYSGHCYLELVEKGGDNGVPLSQARAVIWRTAYARIAGYFEAETGQRLAAGIRILARVMISYHELYGFSLNILDIDPTFTLGDMERQRQITIERLQREGVWDINRENPLPQVVQRIAIVSSRQAAGYQDFCKELGKSPYAFSLTLFDAFMQGAGAEDSIVAALDAVADRMDDFDAVVLIRGGGSASDLNCFNAYRLCAHIAQFPLPILTGIGHDKDTSVADMVAHTALKTPTAVAGWLVERMTGVVGWLDTAALQLRDASAGIFRRHELNHLPRTFLQRIAGISVPVLGWFYIGRGVECPVCGTRRRKFLPYGYVHSRPNALCPRCLSLERHRLLWLYLQRETDLPTAYPRILHIAPEVCLMRKLRKHYDDHPGLYLTADLGRQHPVAETNPPATALQQSADFGIIPQTLHILREQVGRKLQNLARTRFAVPSQAHPVAQMEMRQPAA